MAFFRTILRAITGGGGGKRAGRHAPAAQEGRRKAAGLWAEARKALHEGREAEAVGLARQAAGIEGRCEQPDSPFGFSASSAASELAALAKVPIADALPGFDAEQEHLLRVALAFGSMRGDGLDVKA